MRFYSVIIPVYNRPQEALELLQSLALQTYKNFEVIIVEDGSSEPCQHVVKQFEQQLQLNYYFKPNTGPGDSRNFGMNLAQGEYLIFFDSDCIIPEHYFERVEAHLNHTPLDAFGGPDAAHDSFSDIQKSINQAMTSFITTGGIRGRKNQLDQFQPRSFNMGISKKVYDQVGGFSDIHPGEDPDLSYRIMNAGFKTGLIHEAFVYHKRRIDFDKFYTQVNKFGKVRVILMKWYPEKTKLVYFLPAAFVLGSAFLVLLSLFTPVSFSLFFLLTLIVFIEALLATNSPKIAAYSVLASYIQLLGYGIGFIESYYKIKIKGLHEREAFPKLFFKK
jgi:glycosyltransferase involved in cell wall biosynthesis